MRWAMIATIALACGSEPPPPECPSPIPSQRAPSSMEPATWLVEIGCVEISYHPDFRDREAELIDAVKQWTGNACNNTCFGDPVERATPDDGQPLLFTIHFAPLLEGGPTNQRTAITYRQDTGQIDRALVEIDPRLSQPSFRQAVLVGTAFALGFEEPPDEVESVLHRSSDLTELSSADRRGYCAKYGICGGE